MRVDATSLSSSAAIATALPRDVVAEIEKLIMRKTAPEGHEVEWLLLYIACCELRALRLTREILREQLKSAGIVPVVVESDPIRVSFIAEGDSRSDVSEGVNPKPDVSAR